MFSRIVDLQISMGLYVLFVTQHRWSHCR